MIDRAIQIHGALGYSADLPLEEMYRTARNFRISDGADEVHIEQVAKMILQRYTPVEGYPTEHIPTRTAEAERKYAAVPRRPGSGMNRHDARAPRASPPSRSTAWLRDQGLLTPSDPPTVVTQLAGGSSNITASVRSGRPRLGAAAAAGARRAAERARHAARVPDPGRARERGHRAAARDDGAPDATTSP